MITEVQITEGSAITRYAQYNPTANLQQWLEKLVHDVVLAPKNLRKVVLAGTSWTIDRANVTSVTITQDAN